MCHYFFDLGANYLYESKGFGGKINIYVCALKEKVAVNIFDGKSIVINNM